MFNDTIYNNIAMGKAGCTKEEVERAAKQANAFDFIMGLEERFETMVGIGGGRISGVSTGASFGLLWNYIAVNKESHHVHLLWYLGSEAACCYCPSANGSTTNPDL